ncbi:MAG: 8-amino-7-oxononanoate synthase [Proteobacteria bacterium]|nr:8-amino-7-oxononanoate synthase [Pseudomonadota bacterium]
MRPTYSAFTLFNAKLRQNHLLRHLPRHQHYALDFSTNDYLGLSQHPYIIDAAIKAADKYGVGYKASRLVSANQQQIQALEKLIAQSKNAASSLIFNSGFQANISVISALLDPKVQGTALVFADRLNHASMHAACQLAHIKQQRFNHLDYDHLAYLLAKAPLTQPKFILTESVFGMDGDVADLARIISLAKQYKAFTYVDEAHASGLFGKQGYGLTEDFPKEIDVVMGTFSKALGGSGAYITCHKAIKRYLVNRAQGFVFSTGPSPMQVAAMQAAWELIPSLQTKVKSLFEKAAYLKNRLLALGFDTGNSSSHIIPLIMKEAATTMRVQAELAKHGIRVSAIRPPSVPSQKSRLRIALTLSHTDEDINLLIKEICRIIN